jgi:flagellin
MATNRALKKNLMKLSSGYRITCAADDAAGLAISERFRTQIRGLDQAIRNTEDGISLVQTVEGALVEIHAMLQRMRTLAVQVANETYADLDRAHVQEEVDQLLQEIDRMASAVNFNTLLLLWPDTTKETEERTVTVPIDEATSTANISIIKKWEKGWIIHVGANKDEIIKLIIPGLCTSALNRIDLLRSTAKIAWSKGLTTRRAAEVMIEKIDSAINIVSRMRANMGAYENRLTHIMSELAVTYENMAASESRIRDLDIAKEMSDFTKNQILSQAGTAMLAQANLVPQIVLQLLG